ncbi:hypothetical protein KY284_027201 [Solanum tuberosum]|nr:hypothetical protein KY284_027201 [Solanum tuberosum]
MLQHHFSYDDLSIHSIPVTTPENAVEVSVDIEDVSPNIAADHTADVGVGKLARGSRPPIWHKDYVVKAGSSTCLYPLSANIDYSGLSSKYQSYVSKFSTKTELSSYIEVDADKRWVLSMKDEIQTLEDNKT